MRVMILLAPMLLVLGACSRTHDLTVMPHDGRPAGSGIATSAGTGQGPITLAVDGSTYEGRWVLGSTGVVLGSGFGTGTVYSPAAMPTFSQVYGQSFGTTGQSTGSALMTSVDGDSLRCQFQFSEFSQTGIGACQDGEGRGYDLQIH